MQKQTFCHKCKKTNLFGDLDIVQIAKKQARKEKTKADETRYMELYKKYIEENKLIAAGCRVMDRCIVCGTELIEKPNTTKAR